MGPPHLQKHGTPGQLHVSGHWAQLCPPLPCYSVWGGGKGAGSGLHRESSQQIRALCRLWPLLRVRIPQRPGASSPGKPLLAARPLPLTQGPAPTVALLEAFLAPLCTPPTPRLAHSPAERQHWSLVEKGRAQGGWEFKKDQPLLQPSDAHPGQRKILRAEERGHVRRYACPGISFSRVKASCAPGKRHRGENLRRVCRRSSPCSTPGWAEPRVLGVSEWRPH